MSASNGRGGLGTPNPGDGVKFAPDALQDGRGPLLAPSRADMVRRMKLVDGIFGELLALILGAAVAVMIASAWHRWYLDCGLWPQAGLPYCAQLGNPRFIWDPGFIQLDVNLVGILRAAAIGVAGGVACLIVLWRRRK